MLTQDQKDRARDIILDLDNIARGVDHHEYGLPIFTDAVMEQMVAAVAPDIADRPESDGEPLTVEWLELQGFEPQTAPVGSRYWLRTIEQERGCEGLSWTKLRLHEPDPAGHWATEVLQGIDAREENGVAVLLNRKTTRGDIKRLCEAMGWPLTRLADQRCG